MKNVLFVCIHNSARSQMAEAFLNGRCPQTYRAQSAGLEPGKMNPRVVQVMAEVGFDLSGKSTQSVDDVISRGENFDIVVTVCDEASAERCPFVPGAGERLHWGFPDPSSLEGTEEFKLAQTRLIRDQIRDKIYSWCQQVCPVS